MSMRSAFEPANDVRPAIYLPKPDRRVDRALARLLNEPDQQRRGRIAWAVIALVLIIMLCGVKP